MGAPAVAVNDLVKRYSGRDAILNGLTFAIDPGEFLTLYGRSGSGKTTLLNIIGGLDRPTAGEVRIDGESIIGMSEDQLARLRLDKVGFVFQEYNLLTDLTVKENIALPLQFSRKKTAKSAQEWLKEFDIAHVADEKPNTISGGEAQRVAIARAMINEPRIILADEPTGNLDSENTARVVESFRMICENFGTTVVLATHDLELSAYSTNRLTLEDGRAIKGEPARKP